MDNAEPRRYVPAVTSLLLRFALLATALTACTDDSLSDTRGNPRELTVNWTFKTIDGGTAPCPPGKEAFLFAYTGGNIGAFREAIPCESTGTFTMTLFTSGALEREWDSGERYLTVYTSQYSVWLMVEDSPDPLDHLSSFRVNADLRYGNQTVEVEIYPDAGVGMIQWSLEGASDPAYDPITCADARIDTIEYRYHAVSDPTAFRYTERWSCTHGARPDADPSDLELYGNGTGFTPFLAPGEYSAVTAALRNGGDVVHGDVHTLRIEPRNYVTEHHDSLAIPAP